LTIIRPWYFAKDFPQMTDDVFDGREPTLLIIDDLMSETNQLVADIFTTISHHRNITVIYMTMYCTKINSPELSASMQIIWSYSKNPGDANQFAVLSQ